MGIIQRDGPDLPTCSRAIIIAGPAAVGKTAAAHYVKEKMHELFPEAVRYLSGDMFAHVSFPWRAGPEQLDRKYDSLRAAARYLLQRERPLILIIDDLFRRENDLKGLLLEIEAQDAIVHTFHLQAAFQELARRNELRSGFQRAPTDILRDAFLQDASIDWSQFESVDADVDPRKVAADICAAFLTSYKMNAA